MVHGGCGFRARFKHTAVFANSAMSARGGFLLRTQILTGFLSEKAGRARITPPLYSDGFSRTGRLDVCGVSVCVVVFLDNGCSDPHLLSGFLGFGKDIFHVALSRHCGITFQRLSRASPDVQDQRKLSDLSCFPSILSQWGKGY